MSAASLAAYDAILPKLSKRNRQVFEAILIRGRDGATNREVAADLFLERDSVSPRTGDLMNFGLLYESGSRNGQTVYHACADLNTAQVIDRIAARRKKKASNELTVDIVGFHVVGDAVTVSLFIPSAPAAFADRIQSGGKLRLRVIE